MKQTRIFRVAFAHLLKVAADSKGYLTQLQPRASKLLLDQNFRIPSTPTSIRVFNLLLEQCGINDTLDRERLHKNIFEGWE